MLGHVFQRINIHKKVKQIYCLTNGCKASVAIPIFSMDLEYCVSGGQVSPQRKYVISVILFRSPAPDNIGGHGVPKSDLPHGDSCYEQRISICGLTSLIKETKQGIKP